MIKNQEDDRRLLLMAALVPQAVSLDLLVEVLGQSPVQLLQQLSRLADEGVLEEDATLGKGHYRLRESVSPLSIVTKSDGEEVSEVANALIDNLLHQQPEGVERHLTVAHISSIAGLMPERADWMVEAGRHSQQAGLSEAAVSYYRLALSSLSERDLITQKDWQAYTDCVLGLIKLQGRLMPLVEQKELLVRALSFAESLKSPVLVARLKLVYAKLTKVRGEYTLAAQLFDESWQLAEQANNKELLHQAALATAEFLFWEGRVRDAVQRYEAVVGSLEVLSTDEETLKGCATLGWCYSICGNTARGIGLISAVHDKGETLSIQDVTVYSDLMMSLALLEARRITDAEPYVKRVLSQPAETLGHYLLWAAEACMAFICYTHGDLDATYSHQSEAYKHSRIAGWPHHRGPFNFEYLDGLEDAGIVHPEMSYDSELKRVLDWPDIFMQGVGWRYKAKRAIKKKSVAANEIQSWLDKSMELLQKSGAMLELSRTQIYSARLLLEDDQESRAVPLIHKAWETLCTEHEELFPQELRMYLPEKKREDQLIRTFVEIGNNLGSLRDRESLLKEVINLTVRVTGAERGGFFLVDSRGHYSLAASRNLEVERDSDQENHLITALREATETEDGQDNTGDEGYLRKLPGRGWTICSPVSMGGQRLGAFYLENRLVFTDDPERRLPLLRIIGNQLAIALDNARAYKRIAELKNRLEEETRLYRSEKELSPDLQEIVGKSEKISDVLTQLRKVATTSSDVLLLGETGVGKELVARAIHRLSTKRTGPFIPVAISSLTPELISSELFGHERGAFTGANKTRLGRFELADGGTVFLDEIDTLSLDMQVKLLRVLQEREFERVGGSNTINSNFRVIAATNQNLEERVQNDQFRSDLFYRLKVFPIRIPPLRERKEDIPLLSTHFLEAICSRMGKRIDGISESTVRRLTEYPWPGNVRELHHVIERAVILSDGKILKVPQLQDPLRTSKQESRTLSLEEMERSYIISVLEMCNWKVSGTGGAAELLKVKASTLFSKIKKLGISKKVQYAIDL